VKLRVRETPLRVPGFRFAGVACGIKPSPRLDLALIYSERPATVAAVFTRNRVKAAPVVIAARHVRKGRARAVLINSGNANACTGTAGMRAAIAGCRAVGEALGVSPYDVIPCSTGKIGVLLAEKALVCGARQGAQELAAGGLWRAARAMMTTDAFPKVAVRRVRVGRRQVTIAGLAKGAGMIAPDLATLLVCVVTDATVAGPALDRFLRAAVATSFNAITVDGDTSTNDTVLLLAGGAAGNRTVTARSPDHLRLTRAVTEVLGEIARLVVLDGEGSTRVVEIVVRGARSSADARRVARAMGDSMLCKAAFHGGDPNWGRFVMAAGNAGVPIDQTRVDVTIGGVAVARRGRPLPGALGRARRRMRAREVTIALDLHLGRGEGRILAADLSVAYVRFNAEYTT